MVEKMGTPIQTGSQEEPAERRKPRVGGEISHDLAHELNNLLTLVQGHADHLLAKNQQNAALTPGLKKISEAAHRAALLVRNAPRLDSDPPTK